MFALTAAVRAPHLGLIVTQDEDNWVDRASTFRAAIARGDWAATYRTGHPGVTTMWLAGLGMGSLASDLSDRRERLVTRSADFMPALEAGRRPMVIANAVLL